MDKQIEEMHEIANIMIEALGKNGRVANGDGIDIITEALYNAGYRKIPENAVVLTEEEYEELQVGKDFNYGYHNGEKNITAYYENIRLPEARKETAEKFAERLKEKAYYTVVDTQCVAVHTIDEICKEITEGKV